MSTDTTEEPGLSAAEERAVRSLQALASRWPRTLTLASMGGELVVVRTADRRFLADASSQRQEAILAEVRGIPNTGGDW